MILLTGFYLDPDPARFGELLECLRRNALNEIIEEIYVVAQEQVVPSDLVASFSQAARSKLRVVPQRGRLTFEHLFAYANALGAGWRVVIANADIYFDNTLRRLVNFDLSGKLLCLSRWDVQGDGSTCFFEHAASQDAWIFETPMRAFRCDFRLGVPACDNRLAWEAERAGLAVSNPSRSVHANHLHLSGVRRYTERERLPGPTRAVPAGFLGTPWLWFVLSIIGSATGLCETISSLARQGYSNCIVVYGAAADGSSTCVLTDHASVSVIPPSAASPVTSSQAWNRGAAAVDDDGIICFVEAGTVAAPGFSEHVLSRFEHDRFFVRGSDGLEGGGALVCSRAAFSSVGGFDETIVNPREAYADLCATLRRARLKEHSFCSASLSYRANSELTVRKPAQRNLVVREPLAVVAFHETMGCTVARLTAGASSHNNDHRPFDAVPDALLGRAFTQAVACYVSPIEVQFLHAGKLYVLVGTDWDGYYPASAWLSGKGTKEILPLVTTARGTAFEVWSLLGGTGERLVIPTQVVLVGDRLVRA
jgi:hypothetical protein